MKYLRVALYQEAEGMFVIFFKHEMGFTFYGSFMFLLKYFHLLSKPSSSS
jgi:hypothetical protein